MANKKKEETMPRRVPAKAATFGPESGPSGDLVVDVDAPPPPTLTGTVAPVVASEKNGILVEATAKDRAVAAKSKAKTYRVRATRDGYLGLRHIKADTVFDMQWSEKENGRWPSWVMQVADPDAAATSSVAHSSEAHEEVVDDEGIGHDAALEEVL